MRIYIEYSIRFLLLTLPVFAFFYTEKPTVRFKKFSDVYTSINSNTGNIDLATLGSSRVKHAINAFSLEKEIKTHTKEDWIVYDLAIDGRGMGVNYLLLKELLKTRKVKRVIIEYHKGKNDGHIHFFHLLGINDILTEFKNKTDIPIIKRISFILSELLKRTSKCWEKLFLGSDVEISNYSVLKDSIHTTIDTNENGRITTIKEKRLRNVELRFSKTFFSKRQSWDFEDSVNIRTTNYVKDIIKLTKEFNVELTFVHYVGRYTDILSEQFIKEFKDYFKIDLLQPDEETIRSWYGQETYIDPIHMSVKGSKLFSEWLAEELFLNSLRKGD